MKTLIDHLKVVWQEQAQRILQLSGWTLRPALVPVRVSLRNRRR